MPTARSASSSRSAARSTTRSPTWPTGSATSPVDPHHRSAALANVVSTGLSTDVCPVLSVRYQPLCPHYCPQVVDNSGDGQACLQEPGLGTVRGQPVDDTPSSVDNHRTCGQLTTVHNKPDLSTSIIHGSSTGPRAMSPATTVVVHTIHRPYYNDET